MKSPKAVALPFTLPFLVQPIAALASGSLCMPLHSSYALASDA